VPRRRGGQALAPGVARRGDRGDGHLAAVWNITSAARRQPTLRAHELSARSGLPCPHAWSVKLAPFTADTLQHFVFLERPHGSTEQDGAGFAYERPYVRGGGRRLTPMPSTTARSVLLRRPREGLRAWCALRERNAFDGASGAAGSRPRGESGRREAGEMLKTASLHSRPYVEQGEGAPRDTVAPLPEVPRVALSCAAHGEEPGLAPAIPRPPTRCCAVTRPEGAGGSRPGPVAPWISQRLLV